MTTTTPTLAEFLLARYAEDEASIDAIVRPRCHLTETT